MPYLILALMAFGIAAAQAGAGGMKLLYALPAYGLLGLAALGSLFEPAKRLSIATSTRCLAAALALAACIIVRAVFSPVDYLARPDLFMTLAALIVYLLSAIFLSDARSRRVLFVLLCIFAAAHLALGVLQFQDGKFQFPAWIERTDWATRATGFYLSPNHLAGLLETLGVLAASFACWSNWRLVARMVAGYTALLCFIGVALTGSRGGYASSLAGLIVFAVVSLYIVRRLRRPHFWPAVVAVIMLFSAAIGGGGTLILKSRMLQDRFGQKMEDAKTARLIMWDAAAKQFHLSPLNGTGSGTHVYYGKKFRNAPVTRDATHVQNDYLELLCEYGLMGVIAMAAFLGIHLWTGLGGLRRILAELDDVGGGLLNNELAILLGALAALAALAVHSCFDCNLHVPGNTLVVAFLFSILAAPTIETLLPGESAEPPLAVHWLRFLPPVIGLYLLVVGVPRVEAEFYAERAAQALHAGDFPTAARSAESGITVEKKNPHLFYYFGEAQDRLASAHRPDSAEFFRHSHEALSAFREGLALFPDDLRLLLAQARTLDTCGRFPEASVALEKALATNPHSAATHALYSRHFEMQNLPRDARGHYQRAVNLGNFSDRLDEIPAQRLIDHQPQP